MTTIERPLDLASARERLADDWRARDPHTPEDITAFYRETEHYPADLNAWHELPERQSWTAAVVAAAQTIKAQHILDVGAGMGHDLRMLRERIPGARLSAVEPNHGMRAGLVADGFTVAATIEDVGRRYPFDLISCLDVLEHVPDPEALLGEMIDRLRMGGIIVEATATHDIDTPLHLPALRGWAPGRFLDRHGFVVRDELGRVRVWQRVAAAGKNMPTLLMCAYRSLSVETAQALLKLHERGWRHSIHRGDALISRVRSVAVSGWYRECDADAFLMIDDDIVFSPQDAQRVLDLAREKRGIACAAYPVRGGSKLACWIDGDEVVFGPNRPPLPIRYAATGFMAVHRDVIDALIPTMPLCHEDQQWAMWPLFQPTVIDMGRTHDYLSEDYAFCHRAKALGFEVWLDPSVILTHLGVHRYTVHDLYGAIPEEGEA